MQIFNPSTEDHFQQRDALLQTCLRETTLPFSIAEEYPLVLSRSASRYSSCLAIDGQIIAHANLWPRFFHATNPRGSARTKVALVGNVATHSAYRGRGLMQKLFSYLRERARKEECEALILWSDLSQFYQKLGFQSFGAERRFFFSPQSINPQAKIAEPLRSDHLHSDLFVEQLMSMRAPTPLTLDRSTDETKQLLKIPRTLVLADEFVQTFLITGKGYDLNGVIHEWGAKSVERLLGAIAVLLDRSQWPEVILLAPRSLDDSWQQALCDAAHKVEDHPMAWASDVGDNPTCVALSEAFIWGLDSI